MRKHNIIFVVLATSILVLGWTLYDTRQEIDNLDSTLKHSITLRTFNFTIVLSRTIISPNFNDRPIIVGEGAAIENVTLVSADDTANMLNLSKLRTGSKPLDISDLLLFGGKYVLVDTYGYDFSNILTKSTGPVTHEEGNNTIEVTYYTFSGQVDLLYLAYTQTATFYFAVQPYEPFNLTETSKSLHKVVSLPSAR